jgi:hypothetical protein
MPRASSAAERRSGIPEPEPDQALSHLLIRMANDVTRLRQEVDRNRQEINALSKALAASPTVAGEPAAAARLFDAAGFTGYMAILLLAFAFALLLDVVLPAWVAFLIVGSLFAGGAYVLYRRGEDRVGPAPTAAAPTEPMPPA